MILSEPPTCSLGFKLFSLQNKLKSIIYRRELVVQHIFCNDFNFFAFLNLLLRQVAKV